MIQAERLRKTFNKGKVVAVDDVSFTARDGQITGLLGPNGAGKTTTLRMLYTLLKPDSGHMTVDGIDPLAEPIQVKRKLGVVPDSRGLYDRLTARENIRYYGKLQGLDRNLIASRIDKLAGVLDMGEFIDRRVVLSTHIMQEVAALCDRIVIISSGRIAAEGTAQQLLERSREKNLEDAFVKLIGSDEGLLA